MRTVILPKSVVLSFLLVAALSIALAHGAWPAWAEEPGGSAGAAAALGTGFTYQGRLTDGGSPANGTYDFEFRLYDALIEGTQVGSTIVRENVTVTDGRFAVLLDFGSGAFTGEARYLAVGVRPGDSSEAFTPLSPRQALTPSPYALFAQTAQSAQSVAWSALTGVPAGFADGVDNDSGGDVTAVTAGEGLTGGGTNGDLTLSLDTSYTDNRYWKLGGNSGTTPGTHFLGTTDSQPLELRVGGKRILRLEPANTFGGPNVIAGSDFNSVGTGVVGATIAGGGSTGTDRNRVLDSYGTVGGGNGNLAGSDTATPNDALYATVGGGERNVASGSRATIAGGRENTASGQNATVGGGSMNTAGFTHATVAGGAQNSATGLNATVGGGINNTAGGISATVPGGASNTADGDYSFAAGQRAKANHDGAFVWGDSGASDIASPGANTFIVRARGGIWFGNNNSPSIPTGRFINTSTGGYLSTGGAWTNGSDRNAKEAFAPVDPQAVLEAVAELPISTWNYKAEDPAIRHMGPTAQDFYAAFGLGAEETTISTIDGIGVSLAAIQGLYQQNQALQAENDDLRAQNDSLRLRVDDLSAQNDDLLARVGSLEAQLAALEARLAALEQTATDEGAEAGQ